MRIDSSSVIKAGGFAAAAALILAVLSAIPVLGCLVAPLACLGFFLLPLAAGLGYGYFAPGRESLQESALGGALAGGFGGFVYGLISGIMSAITNAGAAAYLEDLDVVNTGAGSLLGAVCAVVVFVIGGMIFGAIGGALWPVFQGNKA